MLAYEWRRDGGGQRYLLCLGVLVLAAADANNATRLWRIWSPHHEIHLPGRLPPPAWAAVQVGYPAPPTTTEAPCQTTK